MKKYTSNLALPVKNMVEWKLEHYWSDKRSIEQYWRDNIPSPTPAYSAEGGRMASGASRKTENVTVRIATSPYITQVERDCQAIERVYNTLDSIDKRLIDLIYWRRSHTITGAAQLLNLGNATAYRHLNKILGNIAVELGYISINF